MFTLFQQSYQIFDFFLQVHKKPDSCKASTDLSEGSEVTTLAASKDTALSVWRCAKAFKASNDSRQLNNS